jgi:predicted Zn-dependent protease
MIWRRIKNLYNKVAAGVTLKMNPDGSQEIKFSLSPLEDSRKLEEIIKRFASENIKTIGDLSPAETFTGLVAAALYFFHIGSYTTSARYAEGALKNEPKNNNLRTWLIKVYGNYIGSTEPSAKQKAIEMCAEAIKIEPNNYEVLLCNAVYTSHIKTPNESIPLYLEAKKSMEDQNLTKLSDYGQLCSFLGAQYLEPSNYKDKKQAEALFRQAILTLQLCTDKNSKLWLVHTKKCLEELQANS